MSKQNGEDPSSVRGDLPLGMNHISKDQPLVLGVWDLRVMPITLGGVLFLVEELNAQAMVHRADIDGICFVSDWEHPIPGFGASVVCDAVERLDKPTCAGSLILSMLFDLEGINTIYRAGSLTAIEDFVSTLSSTCVAWPSLNTLDEDGRVSYRYGTTFFLQNFYSEHGRIPEISMKPHAIRWALDLIKERVTPSIPIVVNLKNAPSEHALGNADFDAWLAFFHACLTNYDVTFILIGNDDVDGRIRKLSNVLVSQDLGSTLTGDLALLQTSFAFMGMASGPCNMALFSRVPYVIYKNPDHHAEEMMLELGEADRFSFAAPLQKILRVPETSDGLMSEFAHIYAHVNRLDWENRLISLM